jgi:protein phosphatase
MGTTLTAALVEDDEVSFAHVGDSRAYLFRDGELKLLTSDHSLVEELRRQGRLTDEQAEDHPQRSIITRALGPEREVEVDTMTYRARPGDVYLLCSDGLTTMVREDRIAATLADTASLDAAVSSLVREANEAGGRDNITVVAFRLEEAEREAETKEQPTLIGPAAEEAGLTAEAAGAAADGGAGRPGKPVPAAGRPPAGSRKWPRRLAKALAVVAVLGALAGAAIYGLRQVYFLGTDSGGRAALYRGLPYELPLGIDLYTEIYAAPIQVSDIPAGRRESATDHTLRSHDDAADLLADLQQEAQNPVRRQQGAGNGKKKPDKGGARKGGSAQGDGSGGEAGQ